MTRTTNKDMFDKIQQVVVENDESIVLDAEQFDEIYKLYKFMKKSNYYYDRKRGRMVARMFKSLLDPNISKYYFSYNWLKKEVLCTESKTLLNIVKNDPTLFSIYESYLEKKKREKHYLSLNDFSALNFANEDEENEDVMEVSE